jgi:osmotically-inducible protein OsmY
MSILGLVVAASFVLPGQLDAVSQTAIDSALTARIETTFLFNEHLSPFNINTSTNKGVVTLSGSVRDPIQKDLASELAASYEGVKNVNNIITVIPDTSDSKPKRSFRMKVEDKSISASVKTRLLYHKKYQGYRIGARTENHVVTLTGIVDNEFQKAEIETVAFQTRGVDRVINQLTIRERPQLKSVQDFGQQAGDEFIEKRVETSILLNRHLSLRKIDVEADNGVVILTGVVDSAPEKTLAESIANNILGVKKVRNDIVVRGLIQSETPLSVIEPSANNNPVSSSNLNP